MYTKIAALQKKCIIHCVFSNKKWMLIWQATQNITYNCPYLVAELKKQVVFSKKWWINRHNWIDLHRDC